LTVSLTVRQFDWDDWGEWLAVVGIHTESTTADATAIDLFLA